MKYTKELIDLLLKDDTTDNNFINQLRGLAFAAQKEIESNSARNGSYASPASSGVQTAGLIQPFDPGELPSEAEMILLKMVCYLEDRNETDLIDIAKDINKYYHQQI